MTEAEIDELLERVNINLNDIVNSMFGVSATGIRPPPPPPPRHLERLVKIVGLAETIKVLALEGVKKQTRWI